MNRYEHKCGYICVVPRRENKININCPHCGAEGAEFVKINSQTIVPVLAMPAELTKPQKPLPPSVPLPPLKPSVASVPAKTIVTPSNISNKKPVVAATPPNLSVSEKIDPATLVTGE